MKARKSGPGVPSIWVVIVALALLVVPSVGSAARRVRVTAPTLIEVRATSQNSIRVEWVDQQYEDGYEVTFSRSSGSGYELAGKVSNQTFFVKNGLLPGTRYYFRVRAYELGNGNNQTDWSDYSQGDDWTWSATTFTTTSTSTSTTVPTSRPIARISAPSALAVGQTGFFDGRGSSDSDGQVVAYWWSFGDGSPSGQGAYQYHSYDQPDSYTVTLYVQDDDGQWSLPAQREVVVGGVSSTTTSTSTSTTAPSPNSRPIASISAPSALAVGQTGFFDGRGSSDSDGQVVAYWWAFGDGSPSGQGAYQYHSYDQPDSYSVILYVQDDDGQWSLPVAHQVVVGGASSTTTTTFISTTTTSVSTTTTTTLSTGGDWARRGGGTNNDAGRGVAVASDGTVVMAGDFKGSSNYGGGTLTSIGGSSDVVLAAYTAAGNHKWSRRFGDVANEYVNGVAVDAGSGVAVGGAFSGTTASLGGSLFQGAGGLDAMVGKYVIGTSSVTPLWSRAFGAAGNDAVYDLGTDSSGNVLATGIFQGTVNFGGGYTLTSYLGGVDLFVVKLDGATGVTRWAKRFTNLSDDLAFGIAVDGNGDVVLTGGFLSYLDFGSGSALQGAGDRDVFVAKLRGTDGAAVWSKRFGSTSYEQGLDVAVDGTGNVLVAGEFRSTVNFGVGTLTSAGGTDVFVLKLAGTTGAPQWVRQIGGSLDDLVSGITARTNGTVGVAGNFRGTASVGSSTLVSRGAYDLYFATYNSLGGALSGKRGGGTSDDAAYGATFDGAGGLLVTGAFRGTADFLGFTLTNSGTTTSDAVLLRSAP